MSKKSRGKVNASSRLFYLYCLDLLILTGKKKKISLLTDWLVHSLILLFLLDYQFMLTNCQKSCKSCPETQDKIPKPDVVEETDAMEEKDAVDEQQEVVRISVLFGERQDASGGRMVETLQVVQDTIDYMRTDDYTKLEKKIKENCMNQHKLCSFWAMIGRLWNDLYIID
jgi:hypothetical protein